MKQSKEISTGAGTDQSLWMRSAVRQGQILFPTSLRLQRLSSHPSHPHSNVCNQSTHRKLASLSQTSVLLGRQCSCQVRSPCGRPYWFLTMLETGDVHSDWTRWLYGGQENQLPKRFRGWTILEPELSPDQNQDLKSRKANTANQQWWRSTVWQPSQTTAAALCVFNHKLNAFYSSYFTFVCFLWIK